MSSIWSVLSQETIRITQQCNLKCDRCLLWQHPPAISLIESVRENIPWLIKSNLFFKVYRDVRCYNIMGGEPFLNPQLLPLLRFLKSQKKTVRLWTNAWFLVDHWDALTGLVDHVMVMVPSSEPDIYRTITGANGLSKIELAIGFLKELDQPIMLHSSIRQDTIQFLPELHEFSEDAGVPLMLHYSASEPLGRDSKHFIKRYRQIPNVFIYKAAPSAYIDGCAGTPLSVSHRYNRRLQWQEFSYLLRQRLSPMYYLRRKFG